MNKLKNSYIQERNSNKKIIIISYLILFETQARLILRKFGQFILFSSSNSLCNFIFFIKPNSQCNTSINKKNINKNFDNNNNGRNDDLHQQKKNRRNDERVCYPFPVPIISDTRKRHQTERVFLSFHSNRLRQPARECPLPPTFSLPLLILR